MYCGHIQYLPTNHGLFSLRTRSIMEVEQFPITIKPAEADELDFVVDTIAACARQGHFSAMHGYPSGRQNLIAQFSRVCEYGKLSRATYRGIETVPAGIWLCEQDQEAAGFLISADIDSQGAANKELYMLAVASAFRGRGVGRYLTDFFCTQFSGHSLYAQCYPASRQMQEMLLHRRFIQYGKTNGGNLLFRLQRT